ncbi:ABC transporter substrate-binding protein [Erwinia sorbitola]|uniref:Aliphatic sulfonate ABC transporter substrate-binding protein n=1 Tax=Erwinia sorbitola TaxID=2681984 RepID=A0A6I6EG30_9GAMM|nr:ABC transporter substrate-binding protein [Erwinia sorbitola]MTD25941.1 aliphatic sulfonate ABC transporter substrate-binding protein [Erwinia sorbitola]QGU87518.1 aliphatic sulfonate ABC transporter substrate-binding protein [Erwinia sorbitola]
MTLRIGSHPNNLSLFILRHRGVLEAAFAPHGDVVWIDYLHGGDSANYLADQRLDVVGTGSTPPVLAQGNGLDVAYLASSPDRTANCALLAMKESSRQRTADIAGARIACMKGSFTDHFLARLLLQNGLTLDDITLVDLNGSDSARALREGRVDLWAAIDPWLTAAQDAKKVRCLAQVGEVIRNRSLFWCRERWLRQSAQQAETLLTVLADNDRWIAGHSQQAAELIHHHISGSLSVTSWLSAIRSRSWGIYRVTPELLAEQQQQADDLLAARFITTPLTIGVAAENGVQA